MLRRGVRQYKVISKYVYGTSETKYVSKSRRHDAMTIDQHIDYQYICIALSTKKYEFRQK